MNEITLNVTTRENGKRAAKHVRKSGRIPGVYYRKGSDPISISSDSREIRPIIYTKDVRIVKLLVDGASSPIECVLKDVTFDPVTDLITHFDLHGFAEDSLMSFEVPVRLVGTAIGVRDGGILQHMLHKIEVKCLPHDLPSHIDVDISDLKINHSIHLREISVDKVSFVGNMDQGVVSVLPPRVDDSKRGGAGEPELVNQKGKKDDK
ncbi:MAG: 50S ribosomal protein L25 [Candidatus Kapaibacterium sp.]|jgi:large subunit ribosomal protein L25